VYEALARLGGHRTADEVADAVATAGHRMSRMSVYNALDALRAARLVMIAEAGSGAVLHEVAREWHHHFVCNVCGEVTDVPCQVGSSPCIDAAIPGAQVDEAQVIFRGTCAHCHAPAQPHP
jgi:Fe2+ or Zn2+ uptake regulation protein